MLVWELYFESPGDRLRTNKYELTIKQATRSERGINYQESSKELDIPESLGTEYKITMKY